MIDSLHRDRRSDRRPQRFPWLRLMLIAQLVLGALLATMPNRSLAGAAVAQTGSGTGLRGEYFNNLTLTAPAALTRTDAQVNFDWASGSPGSPIGADNFSVRWSGRVQAPVTGSYTFATTSDDGVRLWVNGTQVINNWTDHAPTTDTAAPLSLTAGQQYSVTMEFYERTVGAVARLLWSYPGQAQVAIPQAQLYPPGNTTAPSSAVTRIRFFPRAGYAGRMLNGRFTGSNTSQTNDFVELARITTTPAENAWTELTLSNTTVYRYVKYEAPTGGWGNVAEVEFYAGTTRLTGSGFGTAGSWNNSGNDYTRALDGNTTTFFDAPFSDGTYVGLDLGATNQVAAPTFSPAPGTYSSAQSVTITSATSGAVIRYTTNGTTPSATVGTLYTGPITLSANTTLSAIAYKSGLADSPISIGTYSFGTTPPPTGGQKTYHLGNSLTDTINGWFDPIADSAGYNHTYYRSTIPGAPTDWLWDHPGQANGEPDYRVVFDTRAPLDHLSTQPFAGHCRSIENEADYSGRFYNLARQKSPNIQHWLYIQWPARAFDDCWSRGTPSGGGVALTPATSWEQGVTNHRLYTEAVRQRMDDLNDGKGILIVPGGPALAKLKQEIEAGRVPGITDFYGQHFSDDLHLSAKGQYLIGLTFFASIYKRSPENLVTYANTGLTAEQARIYQRIAWETVSTYRWSGVTP